MKEFNNGELWNAVHTITSIKHTYTTLSKEDTDVRNVCDLVTEVLREVIYSQMQDSKNH